MKKLFDYLWKWMAHLSQKPGEKPGVAIVLRGQQGTGKGTFCGVLKELVGRKAYKEVASMGRITGNFNAHLQNALLVNANEALWGGNKSHEGALKALVTDEELAIEPKGVDTYFIKNCMRLIVTSNEAWAVPMGLDDRRFLCLDISDKVKEDTAYFKTIHEQMKNGGYEALMQELMNVNLDGFDVRTKPQTNTGHDMKLLSASPVEQWWYDTLASDGFYASPEGYEAFYSLGPGATNGGGGLIAGDAMVYDENGTRYFNKDWLAEVIQDSRYFKRYWTVLTKDMILRELKKLVVYRTVRPNRNGERKRVIVFPPIEECRRQWDARVKRVDHDWDEESTLRVDPEGEGGPPEIQAGRGLVHPVHPVHPL